MTDPVTSPSPAPTPGAVVTPKPGYKTSEFWLTVVANLLGLAMASGIIAPNTPYDHMAGMAVSLLASMGYTYGRALIKSGS